MQKKEVKMDKSVLRRTLNVQTKMDSSGCALISARKCACYSKGYLGTRQSCLDDKANNGESHLQGVCEVGRAARRRHVHAAMCFKAKHGRNTE